MTLKIRDKKLFWRNCYLDNLYNEKIRNTRIFLWIKDLDPDSGSGIFPDPDPGDPKRPDPNPQHWYQLSYLSYVNWLVRIYFIIVYIKNNIFRPVNCWKELNLIKISRLRFNCRSSFCHFLYSLYSAFYTSNLFRCCCGFLFTQK